MLSCNTYVGRSLHIVHVIMLRGVCEGFEKTGQFAEAKMAYLRAIEILLDGAKKDQTKQFKDRFMIAINYAKSVWKLHILGTHWVGHSTDMDLA